MSLLRYGSASRATRAVVALAPLAAALLAGGCAASAPHPASSWSFPGDPIATAQSGFTPAVDLEADGIEAQIPPPRRPAPQFDDPSEPYSPNYGAGSDVRMPAPVREQAPPLPRDLPAPFRRQLTAALYR